MISYKEAKKSYGYYGTLDAYTWRLFKIPQDIFTFILVNLGCSPNFVTTLSFISFIASAFFFYNKLFIYGAIFYAIRFILDGVDGRIARMKKMETKFGAVYDSASSYIGTIAVSIIMVCSGQSFVYLVLPFLLNMFVLHPLDNLFLVVLGRDKDVRKHYPFLCYEDSRMFAFFIVPIIYSIALKRIELSLVFFIFYCLFVLLVCQFSWIWSNRDVLTDVSKGAIHHASFYIDKHKK